MAPATGVPGCPSCDGMRLRALLTPASSRAWWRGCGPGATARRPGGSLWLWPDSILESWAHSGRLRPARVGAAYGDEELPEASLRMLAAGALVRHRAGGGGFPGARPPALTDDAVRATYQAFADYHTGRCRQLPAQLAGGHHAVTSPSTLRSSPGCRWLSSPSWPT